MGSYTTNYSLYLPSVGEQGWGDLVNANFTKLDTILKSGAGIRAAQADKLTTARTINGTSFNGTANITTANWGTARNITITDGTNTETAVSVNGSGNVSLKLPTTINASINGSFYGTATQANKLMQYVPSNTIIAERTMSWTPAYSGTVRIINLAPGSGTTIVCNGNVMWELGASGRQSRTAFGITAGATYTSSSTQIQILGTAAYR